MSLHNPLSMTFCYCLSMDLFRFPVKMDFFSLSSQRILQFPKKMRRLIFVILDILIHELRSPSNLIHDCFVRVVIAGQLGEIRGFTQERLYLSEEWLHVLQAEIRSPFGLLRDDCIAVVSMKYGQFRYYRTWLQRNSALKKSVFLHSYFCVFYSLDLRNLGNNIGPLGFAESEISCIYDLCRPLRGSEVFQ